MLRTNQSLMILLALAACVPPSSAFLLPTPVRPMLSSQAPKIHPFSRPRIATAPAVQRGAMSSVKMAETDSKGTATGYLIAGVVSAATWLAVSYIALSFHPNPATNAACGFRHNALTMAQAWALPLPVGWAAFTALHSAASVGWDRLKSATYRRLNLGVAVCSLWMAAAVAFGPTFATGYDLFSPTVKIGAGVVHAAVGLFTLSVWARTISGDILGRLVRGVVGSLYALAPSKANDDPDKPDGGASLYAFATAGLLFFAILPQLTAFPLATIPAILGKRLSRHASGFTLLAAVATYCLKDAAERGRSGASTFVTLRRGLAVGSAGHLLVVLAKLVGVDGGGLIFPGGGLWEFYPSMMGAPKATALMILVYGVLCYATTSSLPPAEPEHKDAATGS